MSRNGPISTHVQPNVGNKYDNLPTLMANNAPKAVFGSVNTATGTRNAVFVATSNSTCTQNRGFVPMAASSGTLLKKSAFSFNKADAYSSFVRLAPKYWLYRFVVSMTLGRGLSNILRGAACCAQSKWTKAQVLACP
jgi:hypothetical protein